MVIIVLSQAEFGFRYLELAFLVVLEYLQCLQKISLHVVLLGALLGDISVYLSFKQVELAVQLRFSFRLALQVFLAVVALYPFLRACQVPIIVAF